MFVTFIVSMESIIQIIYYYITLAGHKVSAELQGTPLYPVFILSAIL